MDEIIFKQKLSRKSAITPTIISGFCALSCFFFFFFFSLPENIQSELVLSSLQLVLCRVEAVSVSPYIILMQIIHFWSFGITGLILSQFENRVPLKPVLWGLGGIAPLIFVFFNVFLASRESSVRTCFIFICSWCCVVWRP